MELKTVWTQLIIFTHLDHAKKFVGDLVEVVAGDDAAAGPLAQVTAAVLGQLCCGPIRTQEFIFLLF